jgi:hypothetical protein
VLLANSEIGLVIADVSMSGMYRSLERPLNADAMFVMFAVNDFGIFRLSNCV